MTHLLLACYQVLLILFGSAYLLLRLMRGRGLPGLRQRFGWYSRQMKEALSQLNRPTWIHAVSVGEVLACESLIQELRQRFPDRGWVITTVTPTGQSVAKRLLRGPQDQLLYLPWDLGPVVRRAIRAIHPSLFISVETELWPTLFWELKKNQVPVCIVNGRISPRAYRRYLVVRPFMERALKPVSLFLTQSPQDARRYAAIGAAKDRIAVTGNLKWDMSRSGVVPEGANGFRSLLRIPPQAILWSAGSTHPGEERVILEVYRRLKARYPALRLLIAPRHPERATDVERQIQQAGYSVVRRTEMGQGEPETGDGRRGTGFSPVSRPLSPVSSSDPVILLDTLGELTRVYQISDLVFVGGSLVPKGGHNLVEPAAFGRPILTGSYLDNFQSIAESLHHAGAVAIVESAQELEEWMKRLIEKPEARRELGQRASGVIAEHRGATIRTVERILRLRAGLC